jgi:3-oxoacyl-[acyl-carrier protein] reductase
MSHDHALPRVAIVTGAARGIGAAIALRLAAEGCEVAVLDIEEASCAGTVSSARGHGRNALAVSADVRDEASVLAAVARVAAELGPPSVLVNNAGVFFERMSHRTGLEDWNRVIDINLRGAFLTSRAMQPFFKASPGGRIVNIASVAALGHIGQSAYSAAKAGIVGLTRSLSIEFGRLGATVNAVAPGFVLTDMTRATAERLGVEIGQFVAEATRDVPMGRGGTPEDIAQAVAFFADPRSGYVSGQVLYVAGGPRG